MAGRITDRKTTVIVKVNSIVILILFLIFSGCKPSSIPAGTSKHAPAGAAALDCDQKGTASWYGTNMKGQLTASGDKYDPKALTAASKKFPLGTELNVTNLNNDRNVTVTVNDRGPYSGNRIIDMSVAAANVLGMKKSGLAPVCVQNTGQGETQADPARQ